MKLQYRVLIILMVLLLTLGFLGGCKTKTKQIDPEKHPDLHFEYYEKLTQLYNAEIYDVLAAFDLSLDDLEVEQWNFIELPVSVKYAGYDFALCLYFHELRLQGVCYELDYAYPDQKEEALEAAMAIAERLDKNLGKADETDIWNDWLEQTYEIELDQSIPSWQSYEQLDELVTKGGGGSIMWWDMTAAACPAVKELLTTNAGDACHAVSFNVIADPDLIRITIEF